MRYHLQQPYYPHHNCWSRSLQLLELGDAARAVAQCLSAEWTAALLSVQADKSQNTPPGECFTHVDSASVCSEQSLCSDSSCSLSAGSNISSSAAAVNMEDQSPVMRALSRSVLSGLSVPLPHVVDASDVGRRKQESGGVLHQITSISDQGLDEAQSKFVFLSFSHFSFLIFKFFFCLTRRFRAGISNHKGVIDPKVDWKKWFLFSLHLKPPLHCGFSFEFSGNSR